MRRLWGCFAQWGTKMTRLPTSIPAFAGLCNFALALIFAAMLAIGPVPAAAENIDDYHGAYAGKNWGLRLVDLESRGGDCTAIINHGALGLDAAGKKFVKESADLGDLKTMAWIGNCDANGLISGPGMLIFDVLTSDGYVMKGFEGTADRGALNGNIIYYPSEDDADWGLGLDVRFVSGCNNWNGNRSDSCDIGHAAGLRDNHLAARRAAVTKPIAATPPRSPTPAPASPPSEAAALNAQQNAAAAAWLKADTEAKRVQAQKVAEFERKQADFNRQQAEYARQQEEYKAALAAQQAEVARINKANADAQACFKGDKARCK